MSQTRVTFLAKSELIQRLSRLLLPSLFFSATWTFYLTPLFVSSLAFSAESSELDNAPVRAQRTLELESLRVEGSTRMSAKQIQHELALMVGSPLDDQLVMETRQKLLSLGLFRSVMLRMTRGSAPGKAVLIIELDDDRSVLTDWALGGRVGVRYGEVQAKSVDPNLPPLGYQIELLSRNLFRSLHRGRVSVDIDGTGNVMAGRISYGWPRFAIEDIQFDTEISAINVTTRYLDVLGFGGRALGQWTQSVGIFSELQYGIIMLVNHEPDFAVPWFPKAVTGPRVMWTKETRLQRFYPGDGYLVSGGLIYPPAASEHTSLELSLARTWGVDNKLWFSTGVDALQVGTDNYAVRGEARLDLPITPVSYQGDQAGFFILLRAGEDGNTRLRTNVKGSAGIFGVRYHSPGFIAELMLQITNTPKQFRIPKNPPTGGP